MTAPVLSVVTARNNADLIAEVAKLWIDESDVVLDVTYGRGKWWKGEWSTRRPMLTTNDLDPSSPAEYHHDFRDLPQCWWGQFDVVAFDPPYISQGGRTTSTTQQFLGRYGLLTAPTTTTALWYLFESGMASCARCLRPGGRLLVKCMDFINSGRYQDGYVEVVNRAAQWGLEHVDTFIHHSGTGPQPKNNRDGTPRRQVHSRRAHSYLVVFEK